MEPRWWSHFTSSNTLNCTSSPTRPGEVANQPASPDGHKLKPQRHWQHCIWKDLRLQPVEFTILRFMWCILGSAAYTSVDFWSAMWFINEGFNYTQISFSDVCFSQMDFYGPVWISLDLFLSFSELEGVWLCSKVLSACSVPAVSSFRDETTLSDRLCPNNAWWERREVQTGIWGSCCQPQNNH